jgi:cell division protein FtsQ
MAAGVLVGIASLAFALAGLALLLRSPLFPVSEIEVTSALAKTTKEEIEAATRGRIDGNFFALDTAAVRAALERLPWVRRVSVRRVWPARLEVALEEHVALARWGDDALVNTHGERFPGRTAEALPLFLGPAGTEPEVARRYARFAELLAPLGSPLERVVLTSRYGWQLRLASGLQIALGRDADAGESRLKRFVEAYPATLGRIARSHDYVDLRYANGFALRVPGLKS